MNRFSAILMSVGTSLAGAALLLGMSSSPIFAQRTESVFNGHRIIIPASSVPQPGRHHTNYFFVDSDKPAGGPPPGVETPGSLACVYQLVSGPSGCPISTSTALPTGGVGAIAIVDAGDYPTAASDLAAFSTYFGIPAANLTVTWPGGKTKKPPVYSDWIVEEALDIEWAHAMAPQAKLYLVESVQVNTDPTWAAVKLAFRRRSRNVQPFIRELYQLSVISCHPGSTSWDQLPHQRLGDDHPLDLIGALVDLGVSPTCPIDPVQCVVVARNRRSFARNDRASPPRSRFLATVSAAMPG